MSAAVLRPLRQRSSTETFSEISEIVRGWCSSDGDGNFAQRISADTVTIQEKVDWELRLLGAAAGAEQARAEFAERVHHDLCEAVGQVIVTFLEQTIHQILAAANPASPLLLQTQGTPPLGPALPVAFKQHSQQQQQPQQQQQQTERLYCRSKSVLSQWTNRVMEVAMRSHVLNFDGAAAAGAAAAGAKCHVVMPPDYVLEIRKDLSVQMAVAELHETLHSLARKGTEVTVRKVRPSTALPGRDAGPAGMLPRRDLRRLGGMLPSASVGMLPSASVVGKLPAPTRASLI